MAEDFKILKITIRPDDFIVHTQFTNEQATTTIDRKFFMRFNPGLAWSPYGVVRKIASHMAVYKGNERKIFGKFLRSKVLGLTEDDFIKQVYYLWSSCRYEYRIGKRGIFRLHYRARGNLYEEKDVQRRMAFCQALFQKEGSKRSESSWYWLGDYDQTQIEFAPDYSYEPAYKDEFYTTNHEYFVGRTLAKLGTETANEAYLKKAVEHFEVALVRDRKNNLIHMDMGAALLVLAQIRNDAALFRAALKSSAVALKYGGPAFQVYLNRGVALHHMAQLLGKPSLYQHAVNNFKKSIQTKNDHAFTFFSCANTLRVLAEMEDSVDLFSESASFYRDALKLEKDFKAHMNLGSVFSEIAWRTKSEEVFKDALEQYEKAAQLNETSSFIYFNWATCLFKYHTIFQNDQIKDEIVDILFKSYLLAILRKDWSFAIHIAVSGLIEVSKDFGREDVHVISVVFFEAIQVLHGERPIGKRANANLDKWRGKVKEADIVIDALAGIPIKDKIITKVDDSLLYKAAHFLKNEILKKQFPK